MSKHKAAAGAFDNLRGRSIGPGAPPRRLGTPTFNVTVFAGFKPLVVRDGRLLLAKDD